MPQAFGQGRRRGGRALTVAAVLLAHAVLLVAALKLGVWRDRRPAQRETPPLQVLLLRPAPARANAPAPASARPATHREPQAISVAPPLPEPPVAITSPELPPGETPPPAAAERPASAPPPLDLRLPRRPPGTATARNPALDDPRAHGARPATVESRIATLLGGVDGIVEERLDDGRMRFRRGTSCVLVHPNRAERIDPFNASVLPKMKGVEGC